MHDVTLRAANIADVDTLERWQEQEHVRAAIGDSDWEWEKLLSNIPEWIDCYIAEVQGQPVGFLEIMDPSQETWGYWNIETPGFRALDIWIGEVNFLGKGIGTQMMQWAMDRCFSTPDVNTIILDVLVTNSRVIPLYERLGFVHDHDEVLDGEECHIYQLERTAWQAKKAEAAD